MKKCPAVALFAALVALNSFLDGEPILSAETRVPAVILLQPATPDELTTEAMARVKGELKAAGFDVIVLRLNSDNARRALETAGRDLNPIAAFAIFVKPPEGRTSVAEIWVSDRMKQQTIIQNALLHETDRGRESEILAVRAVELLKANLADFWTPAGSSTAATREPPSSRPVLSPSDGERKARSPFASGLGIGLGVGIVENFGATGMTWAPDAVISYGWPHGFSLRASVVGFGSASTLSAASGSAVATATIEQQLGMLDAVKTWWPRSVLVPYIFAGTGGQHIHVAGRTVAPRMAYVTDHLSLLTTIGLGLGIPLISTLSLTIQARGVVAWPQSVVQIDDADVGRIGNPSLLVDGALMGRLP
ncbi:MAG: hypothetical protein M3O46_00390 [Myxococcota bacterium]|nr:hypothetical protein [Myxococcota bacterium]